MVSNNIITSGYLGSSAVPVGVPVAWMLSSNGTQATIQYFLNLVKAQSPEVAPNIFMTDRDQAQVNAIRAVFPECSRVFYCWWHVLRAIRTHFNTKEFPDLWSRIQDWIRTTDKLLAVPTARVARKLAPLAFSTRRQLVGGVAPKPPFIFVNSSIFASVSSKDNACDVYSPLVHCLISCVTYLHVPTTTCAITHVCCVVIESQNGSQCE